VEEQASPSREEVLAGLRPLHPASSCSMAEQDYSRDVQTANLVTVININDSTESVVECAEAQGDQVIDCLNWS
jgi:hypothetical protein